MRIRVSTSVEKVAPVSVLVGDDCCRSGPLVVAELGNTADGVAVAGDGFSVLTDGLRFTEGKALRASLTCGRLATIWFPDA